MGLLVGLNFVLALFFALETVYADKTSNISDDGTNPIISNILLICVNTFLFSILLAARDSITPSLLTMLMKVSFLLEACLLVNIGFCFTVYLLRNFLPRHF